MVNLFVFPFWVDLQIILFEVMCRVTGFGGSFGRIFLILDMLTLLFVYSIPNNMVNGSLLVQIAWAV